jgi:hypothetical protein
MWPPNPYGSGRREHEVSQAPEARQEEAAAVTQTKEGGQAAKKHAGDTAPLIKH